MGQVFKAGTGCWFKLPKSRDQHKRKEVLELELRNLGVN